MKSKRKARDHPMREYQLEPAELKHAVNLPVFTALSDADLARLFRSATVQRYPVGTILFRENESPTFLHVLLNGIVELVKRADRRDCGLMLLGSGDVFMPAAALFDLHYLNSARTLTVAKVLLLRSEIVREEFARCQDFASNMGRVLAGQFRMAVRHIVDLQCRSATERLADFLLRIVDENGHSAVTPLPVSKQQLARRVGMTPETLSRNLQTLARNGLLVRGSKILVKDRAKINAYCGPSPYSKRSEVGLGVHVL